MSSLFLNRLSHEQRQDIVASLHESQNGNCFICTKEINLKLQANTIDIDHIEPTKSRRERRTGKLRPDPRFMQPVQAVQRLEGWRECSPPSTR